MFVLESVWRLAAPVPRVWSVLAEPRFAWPEWWPGLTSGATCSVTGPDGLAAAGAWAQLRVRSPFGYALRFRLCLAETSTPSADAPGGALLHVTGDLTGRAEVTVADSGGATEVRLLWRVAPGPAWFRVTSRIAPQPLAWAHAHVMRAGERGLATRLRA